MFCFATYQEFAISSYGDTQDVTWVGLVTLSLWATNNFTLSFAIFNIPLCQEKILVTEYNNKMFITNELPRKQNNCVIIITVSSDCFHHQQHCYHHHQQQFTFKMLSTLTVSSPSQSSLLQLLSSLSSQPSSSSQ